jgi:hypothetical protein
MEPGIHLNPEPGDRQSEGTDHSKAPKQAVPPTGGRHSLDTDEMLAARQREEEAISPDPEAEVAPETGPVQPGSVTTGGAASQPLETHQGTAPGKPYQSPEPQPQHKPPKTWGKL